MQGKQWEDKGTEKKIKMEKQFSFFVKGPLFPSLNFIKNKTVANKINKFLFYTLQQLSSFLEYILLKHVI